MRFVNVRELRLRPGEVWKKLKTEKDLVLTSNGKPFAILNSTDEENLEQTLTLLRRSRALEAMERLQEASREKGLDRLSADEIQKEIQSARRER
jgi:PHD/YefM family antitoxin component YafN of YafNO toxin-antitoxin module